MDSYVVLGHENKGMWIKIFNDLVQRKLLKVMMFISDDFHGISDTIHSVFPADSTQNVWFIFSVILIEIYPLLLLLNLFNKLKPSVMILIILLRMLCESYRQSNPSYIKYILERKHEHWQFMNFHHSIRKYLNNTNLVENFNSVIEKARVALCGYFQSIDIAEKTLFSYCK